MKTILKNFLKREDGAVTTDWVVLTSLVTCLVCAAYVGVESSAADLSGEVETYLANVTVGQ